MERMSFKLIWHDTPDDIIAQHEQTVRDDLTTWVEGDGVKPSQLIFHLVFLTKDYNGPNIIVWGEKDDDESLHCQYEATMKWERDNE